MHINTTSMKVITFDNMNGTTVNNATQTTQLPYTLIPVIPGK